MSNFPLASGRPGIPRCAAVAASPDDQRLTHPAVEDRTAAPENRGETLTGKPIRPFPARSTCRSMTDVKDREGD